jgi:hypothetical protein
VLAISIFPLIYRLIPPDFRAQNLDRRAMQHRSPERVVVDGRSWIGNQTPASSSASFGHNVQTSRRVHLEAAFLKSQAHLAMSN